MLMHPCDVLGPLTSFSQGTQFTQAYVHMDGILQKAFTGNLSFPALGLPQAGEL